jgi:hypothetical protein
MLNPSHENTNQTRGRQQMAVIPLIPRTCELASRESNGLKVALFWDRPTDQLTVCVSDVRSDVYFELDAERHNALEVFYHPYAYAAQRGIPYEEAAGSSSHEVAWLPPIAA